MFNMWASMEDLRRDWVRVGWVGILDRIGDVSLSRRIKYSRYSGLVWAGLVWAMISLNLNSICQLDIKLKILFFLYIKKFLNLIV
jgi:hypothetical protein